MDTLTVHKQPRVLSRERGLSGGVYKNLIPQFISLFNLILFLKI